MSALGLKIPWSVMNTVIHLFFTGALRFRTATNSYNMPSAKARIVRICLNPYTQCTIKKVYPKIAAISHTRCGSVKRCAKPRFPQLLRSEHVRRATASALRNRKKEKNSFIQSSRIAQCRHHLTIVRFNNEFQILDVDAFL